MSIQSILADYIIRLQHVGHIVPDLDAAIDAFIRVYGVGEEAVRRSPEEPNEDSEALFAFITIGDNEFELIQPLSERFRKLLLGAPSGGAGINHVAWRVSDLDACLELLGEQGIGPGHVTPDGVFTNDSSRIVYLDPAACGGLFIELIEFTD